MIHAPVRFSIAAALASVDEADFRTLRDTIEISDSALSKQITLLEQAEYVKVRKAFVGKRARTWLSLTAQGRLALARHLAALRDIAAWEPEQAAEPGAGQGSEE
ncbi:winged helix-turn-helix domain-containing protein [Streptomyces sp. CA-243310]|uniref:winged helix-turn-helix domain-containing protein n=1 Tax=Streptomyces sp. CA-243310 TaxID=3240056 RepID=UPI003D90D84E